MKTYYGEGRVWGNSGTFVVEADSMDQARDQIWKATSMKEQVRRPNLLKTATPKMEEILEEAIEKGLSSNKLDKAYSFGHSVYFLEFWEVPRHTHEEVEGED